jgi:hypothetical protein
MSKLPNVNATRQQTLTSTRYVQIIDGVEGDSGAPHPSNSDWVFIQEMIDERGRSSKINARMGIARPHPPVVIHLIAGEIH